MRPGAPRFLLTATGAFVFAVAACSSVSTPSPSPAVTGPVGLYVENRGGPALSVAINGTKVAAVACNTTSLLVPSENGVPPLPWDVSVTTGPTAVVVYSGRLTSVPAWFLQIGGTVLGIGTTPPIGPSGPTCPPGT
jgi:hypothetical protein